MPTPLKRVARLSQLHADRAQRLELDGESILLVRDGDTVHAYGANCPHAGGPLEQGALCEGRIVCPWHKGSFDVATGKVLEPPALMALDRYPVALDGDDVLVSPDKLPGAATTAAVDSSASTAPNGSTASAQAAGNAPAFVIIGAGAAGAAACATLRECGFAGHITMIGREAHVPYDRTSLSKFVPSGEMACADVPPLLPPDWFEHERIERLQAEIVGLDVPKRRIRLADGRELAYDTALLASGSVPTVAPLPGRELRGVQVLRTLDDALALVEAVSDAAQVVIVGSSFIGLETASALRQRGTPVSVVSPEAVPFTRQFGERVGAMFQRLHEDHGVVFHLKQQVSAFEGDETVREVVLENGTRIAADAVLIGTGVSPATGFIEGLPLGKDGGVIVNAGMQAAPGLYAAGDVAVFPLHENQEPLRIEHWRVAQQHARIAAQNMCGARNRYTGAPYFWTYHYGKNFEYLGHATQWDELVVDGELDEQDFMALYVLDGIVAAVLACGREAATARLIGKMHVGLSVAQVRELARD
ncbi:FAD-dependent oxidoreductase [Paraburkholderia fungorum]|uniref:FAD-dependent oxidoreductase n=1 Tax=Paraburkholderia fungorum TaxID=134537 RepID=UPI00248E741F|nr:FAD-dependent oxidoreductase [Paraburkholderia fungorum]